tara:strand:- start:2181 stop:2630 length:450 start_codon:yes stop_codon:yes gene_type:complete
VNKIFLSLGSNINPKQNISEAKKLLSNSFVLKKESAIYITSSEGFEGKDFLNQVILFETKHNPKDVIKEIKAIEKTIGRIERKEKFSDREIDIDLIMYDQLIEEVLGKKIPHDDIEKYNFVLEPLAEIAPDLIHPVLNISISDLWNEKN